MLILLLIAGLLGGLTIGQAQPPVKVDDIVLRTDFEKPEDREGWSKSAYAQWVEMPGRGHCLQVTVPPEQGAGGNMIQLPVDLSPYRGCRLVFECLAKAEGVTRPPQSYLGVKFMLHYVSPTTGASWTNQNDVYGTFDWKKLTFSHTLAADVTTGEISLGLQGCSGTAWFDDITVTVYKTPRPPRPQPPANPGPVFTGHPGVERLRGVMSPNVYRDEDLRVLGQEWKANVIRWQINRNWGRTGTDLDLVEYDKWLDGRLDELDQALAACQKYGLKVVVDLHAPPGGRTTGSEVRLFHEPLYQDHWVKLWEKIARRYQGHPAIWAYDLLNEPVQNEPSPPGVADYLEGQVRVAKAIRAIDPDVPILLECNYWDSPAGYRELDPVDLPKVIYQVHMYEPHQFTHQGVNNSPVGIKYPGLIGGKEWNKETLRQVLAPVREFQLAYNVHIYVGEFSAIRWAPGAAQYLSDCIDLFEEYGWDWTYHAYREWDGWSVEHGAERDNHQPTTEPTDRKRLLLSWFAKNQKP